METSIEFINKIHDLSTKEIAKQIRLDLKELCSNFKFSIISSRHRIDLYIMSWPIEFYSSEYKEAEKNQEREKTRELSRLNKMYTPEWSDVLKLVNTILNQYNHDNSDAMIDYFDVNYYDDVRIWKWDKPYVIV